mmetsp:Transcript_8941/g.22359  ORF Transcript_8941/g.22359 Transcript_8941/m.22359 type:complete len:310 (-) Transcript_8941:242-1171(-)
MNIQRIGGQLIPDGGHQETLVPPICSASALIRNWYSLPGSAQAQHWRPSGVCSSSFRSVLRRHSHGVVVQVPGDAAQYKAGIAAVHSAPSLGLYTTEQTLAVLTGRLTLSPACPGRTPSTRNDVCGAMRWQASSLRRDMSSCSSAGAARCITCGTTVVSQRRLIVTHPAHKPSLVASQVGSSDSSVEISIRGVKPWRTSEAKPFRTSSPQAIPSWHQQTRGSKCMGAPNASAVHCTSPSEFTSRTGSPRRVLKTNVPVHLQVPPATAHVRHMPSKGLLNPKRNCRFLPDGSTAAELLSCGCTDATDSAK